MNVSASACTSCSLLIFLQTNLPRWLFKNTCTIPWPILAPTWKLLRHALSQRSPNSVRKLKFALVYTNLQHLMSSGIPAVRASQDRGTANMENLTIVATLFAGIATGMLQIYSDPPSHTAVIVMWYTTLIFSISSAVNGLLALSWAQAI